MLDEHSFPASCQRGYVRLIRHTVLAIFLFAGWSSVPVRGEDRLPELPKDGTWVRWQCETEFSGNKESTGPVTLSLVGTVIDDGEQSRWLEIKRENRQIFGITQLLKVLIPEKDILKSDRPFEHARR